MPFITTIPNTCPMKTTSRALLRRFFIPSTVGQDISLLDDCRGFLSNYSCYQYRYDPSIFDQQLCECKQCGLGHVPFFQLIQMLVEWMEGDHEGQSLNSMSSACLEGFKKTVRACLESCTLPLRHLLQTSRRQQDQLRCVLSELEEKGEGDEDEDKDEVTSGMSSEKTKDGFLAYIDHPLPILEDCIHLLEGTLDELLEWLPETSFLTAIRSQAFATLHHLTKLARHLNLMSFTSITFSPFYTRLHSLFTQRHYLSHVVPRLAELDRSTLWMVPLALPSFISGELENQSPSLVIGHRVLDMYMKMILRDAGQRPGQYGWVQMASIVYLALELYFNGYDRFQSSLNEIVSVQRSDVLMITWYVMMVVNCKGLRLSKEFAKKLEIVWKDKSVYLKKEVIG